MAGLGSVRRWSTAALGAAVVVGLAGPAAAGGPPGGVQNATFAAVATPDSTDPQSLSVSLTPSDLYQPANTTLVRVCWVPGDDAATTPDCPGGHYRDIPAPQQGSPWVLHGLHLPQDEAFSFSLFAQLADYTWTAPFYKTFQGTSLTISGGGIYRALTLHKFSVLTGSTSAAGVAQGLTLTLWRAPSRTGPWSRVAQAADGNDVGRAETQVPAGRLSYFRWTTDGLQQGSGAFLASIGPTKVLQGRYVVAAASKPLTVRRGQRATLYGSVGPHASSGARVTIQRCVSGRWRTEGTALLARQRLPNGVATYGYLTHLQIGGTGKVLWRAVLPAGNGYAAGTSPHRLYRVR